MRELNLAFSQGCHLDFLNVEEKSKFTGLLWTNLSKSYDIL